MVGWLLILSLCMLLTPAAAERRIQLGTTGRILLRLQPPLPTAAIFPEPIESTVTEVTLHKQGEPAADDPYQADYKGAKLFVLPKDPALNTHMFVVGKSGRLYKVELIVARPADDIVHILTGTETAKAPAFDLPSMIRLLINPDSTMPGQQESDLALPAVTDPRLTLVHASGILVGDFHGFILTVRNAHTAPVFLEERVGTTDAQRSAEVVSLSAVVWPPRVKLAALVVEAPVLAPGAQTRIFAVLKRKP